MALMEHLQPLAILHALVAVMTVAVAVAVALDESRGGHSSGWLDPLEAAVPRELETFVDHKTQAVGLMLDKVEPGEVVADMNSQTNTLLAGSHQ